jgi:hypothetical protein
MAFKQMNPVRSPKPLSAARDDQQRVSQQLTEKAHVKPGINQYKLPKNTFPPPTKI